MSSLMLITTYIVLPLISAVFMYMLLMKRHHTYKTALLEQWQKQQQQQHDKNLHQLTQKRERKLQKIRQRANDHQERDEAKLDDLVEDEERLVLVESSLTERYKLQEERAEALHQKQQEQKTRATEVKNMRYELKQSKWKAKLKLEEKGEISQKEMKKLVIQQYCDQVSVDAQKRSQSFLTLQESKQDHTAQQILDLGSQRYYDPSPAERLINYVHLPQSNKLRTKLLDPQGELLHLLSDITDVEFIHDDAHNDRLILRNAPESYSREIARMTFDRWVKGGQLNTKSLRTHYRKCTHWIEQEAKDAGIAAAQRLGLKGIHPEILFLVGKLLFRTSYTQNQWQHAIEASELAGIMAEEMKMDPILARRATLLHDIGKVLWEETEAVGSHAVSGAAFAKDHGEIPEVIHPIAAHHQDEAPATPLAYLVIAADTLSGARPGARRETHEAFSQHIEQLEGLCQALAGTQHIIIQGGREVRLFIDPDQYSDMETAQLTAELAERIEDECIFPGQIKITALREVVAASYARLHDRDFGYHTRSRSHMTHSYERGYFR